MKAGTKHTFNFQNYTENHGVKWNNCSIFAKPTCTKSKIKTLKIAERVPICINSISDKATLSTTWKSSLKTFTIIEAMLLKSICLFLSSYNIVRLWSIDGYLYVSNNVQLLKSPRLIRNQLDPHVLFGLSFLTVLLGKDDI